jgi:hypothetical protein
MDCHTKAFVADERAETARLYGGGGAKAKDIGPHKII